MGRVVNFTRFFTGGEIKVVLLIVIINYLVRSLMICSKECWQGGYSGRERVKPL